MFKQKIFQLATELQKKILLNSKTIANPSHVDLSPSKGYDTMLHAKVFKRFTSTKGIKELIEIPELSYNNLNILAFGGLDFDSKFHMAALLKSLETLMPESSKLKYGAIYPNADRKTRFEAATTYNQNKLYVAPYIEQLTKTHILPRFLNEKTLDIQEPRVPLTFYSFSVGAREIMMVENCLRQIFLDDYKLSEQEVYVLFSYINSLSIAYAIDYDNLPKVCFKKAVILSKGDIGILCPETLMNDVVGDNNLPAQQIIKFNISSNSTFSHPTTMFYLTSYLVKNIIEETKTSDNGHSLPHYIEAISNSDLYPIVKEILGVSIDANDNENLA